MSTGKISNISKICVFTNYAIRTKKDHLNIVVIDWEQRLITTSNQDVKNHVANDQESLEEDNAARKAMRSNKR